MAYDCHTKLRCEDEQLASIYVAPALRQRDANAMDSAEQVRKRLIASFLPASARRINPRKNVLRTIDCVQ